MPPLSGLFSAGQLGFFCLMLGVALYRILVVLFKRLEKENNDRFAKTNEMITQVGKSVSEQHRILRDEVRELAKERPTRHEVNAAISGLRSTMENMMGWGPMAHPFRRMEDRFELPQEIVEPENRVRRKKDGDDGDR